jgi:hypothetical protein
MTVLYGPPFGGTTVHGVKVFDKARGGPRRTRLRLLKQWYERRILVLPAREVRP